MQVFVTGATGSVGQALLPELAAAGCAVTALARQPIAIEGCRVIVGCLEDIARVAGEIAGCDAIVHLASSESSASAEVVQQDIAGTAGLIDAWRNGPLLFASSARLHGYPVGVLSDQGRIKLSSWHDHGKYANELQLRLAAGSNGRGVAVILRPAIIFAIDSRQDKPNLLGELYAQCRRGSRFVFDSEEGLEQYGCSFISGADFGRAVATALTRNLSGTYNVAGGFCSWREVIETFNRVAGTTADCVVRADAQPESGEIRLPQSRTELDATGFARASGFTAKQSLGELVEALVRMERDAGVAIGRENGRS